MKLKNPGFLQISCLRTNKKCQRHGSVKRKIDRVCYKYGPQHGKETNWCRRTHPLLQRWKPGTTIIIGLS